MLKDKINLVLVGVVAALVIFFVAKNWPHHHQRSVQQHPVPVVTFETTPSKDLEPHQKPVVPLKGVKKVASKEGNVTAKAKSPAMTVPKAFRQQQFWLQAQVIHGLAIAQRDIVLGPPTAKLKDKAWARFRPNPSLLWPSARIPYLLDDGLAHPEIVLKAIDYFNDNTPIRLVPLTTEKDALRFTPDDQLCASYVGRIGGHQPVFISPRCDEQGVLHEIMHALGFVHEQSRVDRDKYVQVLWQNIIEDDWNQFQMMPDSLIHPYVGSVFNFDYDSIMLYGPHAFAKSPGLVTLKSVTTTPIEPDQKGLSRIDKERLYYLYGP